MRAVQGKGQADLSSRVVDLTKQNAMTEVNLIKMARKYQALEEQWKLLSRDYHSRDGELADKDVFMTQRINSLKKWKTEAILQLKLLFEKLKNAVPVTEFEAISRKLNIQSLESRNMQESQIKLRTQIMDLQKETRKNREAEINNEVNQELKGRLEAEIEILTKRLERHDPIFKWENQFFAKVAQVITRAKIRIESVFQEFDKDNDGFLNKGEFSQFLNKVSGDSISHNELEVLYDALDVTGDETVSIHEFVQKLQRYGLKCQTREEHIMSQLIEAVQRSGTNVSDFFQIIDKSGRGYITREDFADLLTSTKLKIDDRDLTFFMNQFWKDEKAGIDFEDFLRIFKKF